MRFFLTTIAFLIPISGLTAEYLNTETPLTDIIVSGFDQPLRIRVVATCDGVSWQKHFGNSNRSRVELLFKQLDSNGDGRLTSMEAKRLPSPRVLGQRKNATDVYVAFNFRVLDGDGDGGATIDELREYVSTFDAAPFRMTVAGRRDKKLRNLFSILDANDDDRLVTEEWSDVSRLRIRDRDGNRVLTRDELRLHSANVFGPEFIATPLIRAGAKGTLKFKSTVPTKQPADFVVTVHYASATHEMPSIDIVTGGAAKQQHLRAITIGQDCVVIQDNERRIELLVVPPTFRRNIEQRRLILREYEAVAERSAGNVTAESELPRSIKEIFSVVDANGDGVLIRTELDTWLTGLARATQSAEASRLQLTLLDRRDGLASIVDRNLDGRLGSRELAGLSKQFAASAANGKKAIARNDVPTTYTLVLQRGPFDDIARDGVDSSGMLLNCGPPWFFRSDQNQDGDLDPDEFLGSADQFRHIDENHDGWIELREAIRAETVTLKTDKAPLRKDSTSLQYSERVAADIVARIDEFFEHAWKEASIAPAPIAHDEMFLRRVMLDLTGVIPRIGEVRAFLADQSPAKRARLVNELLSRPRHASHLANVWRDVLLPSTIPESTSLAFESWLQTRFRNNVPYDELVRELLLARGTLSQSPPVLYYAALDTKPEELAASSSRAFLGVQIRCAQCHDHPFTDWSQDDFWSYAAFFARVRGPSEEGGTPQLGDGPSGEVRHPVTKKTVKPRFLDGAEISTATDEPRRAILARWITSVKNPYFARAAVNRAWWMMFGRGLVEPVDDLGNHNAATHPEVFDLLTEDFVAHGYDLRRLLQIIAGTRVYQLTSKVEDTSKRSDAHRAYTSMPVRSLSAEQIYDCLVQAAGRRDPLDPNDAQIAEQRRLFIAQVKAPTRKATKFQGGIPQTLALLNGPFVDELTGPQSSDLIAALTDSPFLSDEQRCDMIFLAAYARLPDAKEREASLRLIKSRDRKGDKAQAYSDILWALLNSSEFILKQ